MNYKRIMSVLVLFAMIMACTSVAFASGDVKDIGQMDDSQLSVSEDDFDDDVSWDDDSDDSDYELDEDSEEVDWEDDDTDYEDDEDSDDDWEDDGSDYEDDEDSDDDWEDDDSDYEDDEDSDDDWEDDDSDYEDDEDSDDDWEDNDSDYEDDWDDEDWEDNWNDSDVYYEDWGEDFYFDYDDEYLEFLNDYATSEDGNFSGNDSKIYKCKVLYYLKTATYATAQSNSFLATSMPGNDAPRESDTSRQEDSSNGSAEDTEGAPENATIEKGAPNMLMASMMPLTTMVMDTQSGCHQSIDQASSSVSESVDSSKTDKGTDNDKNIVKKVSKSQLNTNYGILALIVILLICFALGYKKFK